MPFIDHRVPECACPKCGHLLDTAGTLENIEDQSPPAPGDATVCIGCAALLRFNDDMSLSEFTSSQLEELDTGDLMDLMKIRAIVIKVKEEHSD